MASAPNTRAQIIEAAIQVLQSFGTEGLTMRKVAGEAEISLGNLQYHFKDKASLMAGLAEHYFAECSEMLDRYERAPSTGSREEDLNHLLQFLLGHVDHAEEITEMCRVFREMWALSSRDSEIHRQLNDYYEVTVDKLVALLLPFCSDEKAAKRFASFVLPYMEGYSITGGALPIQKNEIVQILTETSRDFFRE